MKLDGRGDKGLQAAGTLFVCLNQDSAFTPTEMITDTQQVKSDADRE